jgi:hypothetical protein
VEIRDLGGEIPLAPPEYDLTLNLEFLEHSAEETPGIGAAVSELVHHLSNEHGKTHPTPSAATDGGEDGLGIEFSWLVVCHLGDD